MNLLTGPILLLALMGGSSSPTCIAPPVEPTLELMDLMSFPRDSAGVMGDGICELYCGVVLAAPAPGIPLCASYQCTFTLEGPGARRQVGEIRLARPWTDHRRQSVPVLSVESGHPPYLSAGIGQGSNVRVQPRPRSSIC
jgi:hypothetical protein